MMSLYLINSMISDAAAVKSLRKYKAAEDTDAFDDDDIAEDCDRQVARATRLQTFARKTKAAPKRAAPEPTGGRRVVARYTDDIDDEDADDDEDSFAEMEHDVGLRSTAADGTDVLPNISHDEIASDLDALLVQLIVEPTKDAEIVAKFTLFENFLATVTVIRDETLGFWQENRDQFEGPSLAAAEHAINKIDEHEAMGVQDDPSKWIVYTMTKKANGNNAVIRNVLSLLRARLAMLGQELGDCPFCLSAMETGKVVSLGCCHRTCRDCWDHWVALKGETSAFCPLCMHQPFLEEIVGGEL